MLEVRDLSFVYPSERKALDAVSFYLEAGERVALVGPNGAGKSTLLLHLNGLLPRKPPSTANVFIGGEPVTAANLRDVRRRVGLVFQDPDDQLFCPTVLEDVAFGPLQLGLTSAEARRRAREALAAVGLIDMDERTPQRLSTGEKKRACIAGVLACRPDVLALDEPTANLDPRGRRELLQLLDGLSAAMVAATHDLEFALALCDRVLVLNNGRIQADGRTKEILADAEFMEAHGLESPASLRSAVGG